MSKQVLAFQDVSFSYQDQQQNRSIPVLHSFSTQVYDREFITIIGASGSGKSTLFRLIAGLEEPDSGSILINGKKYKSRLGQTGYMPQKDLLMPWRTIEENAALPLELRGWRKKDIEEKVRPLLEEFGLSGVENHFPHELSGGMRQRVSFLRTVLSGSNILLLDEPFSALDAITKLSMQEWLLDQWDKRKATIIFITHDVQEALLLSDRILIFAEKPVCSLQEVAVPLARPRRLKDLDDPAVLELKDHLLAQLRGKVGT